MQAVGRHLASHCGKCSSDVDIDQFGRSAFNRFYYATFLLARSFCVARFDANNLAHKDYPGFFNRTVYNKYSADYRRRAKNRSHNSHSQMDLRLVRSCCKRIAELLEQSYAIRVVADYRPDESIVVCEGVISLADVGLKDAEKWEQTMKVYIKQLEKEIDKL